MAKKLSNASTVSLVVAAILLVVSVFLPWWGMNFTAPQYPEGLDVIVYPYKLDGKVDIVNGLNHYIGMKAFSSETFPELRYLPYLIVAMAGLILVAAFLRKKSMIYLIIALFVVGGILGIYDIHRWLTDFGTNLDPRAPIKIDPFVPPIFGKNVLANFVTFSYFSYGAFVLGISFILSLFPLWKDRAK